MVTGVLDLSYMGVYTVWKNLLGTISPFFPFIKAESSQVKRLNPVSTIALPSLTQFSGSI